jgi:catechol 2,3-dioxygenase-like lactoylglutathione lyase family enzyme
MGAMEAWYRDVLGFRVSDYSADMMVFLRCATRSPLHRAGLGQYPSVNHVAFELPTLERIHALHRADEADRRGPDLGAGAAWAGEQSRLPITARPPGFVIEFTCELQQIDEATHQVQVWSREDPEAMDRWMTAGPPTSRAARDHAGPPRSGLAGAFARAGGCA